MRVRWAGPAIADLSEITDYIASDSPVAADLVAGRVLDAAMRLADFPNMGRAYGNGVRLLPVARTSVLLVYEVDADVLTILHVRHMARKPYGEE